VKEGTMPGEIDRYNMRRVVSMTANVEGEDLGRVAARVAAAIRDAGELPAGVQVDVLDSGCCGLAGNFGFERGHYEVSVACAERGLWPAAADAAPQTAVLADGFSCRTQLAAGNLGREGVHLAQLLAGLIDSKASSRG